MTQADGEQAQLCGYRVNRRLGTASVLATDERGRAIIIKKLDSSCLLHGRLHPAILDRLQHVRELPLMNVANLIAIERDGEAAYLIWSYVEGRTLNEVLADPESPEASNAARREAKFSIDSLHSAGLVHGAIHGNNIVIDEHGKAHLTHISPLLFHDPGIDDAAFNRIAATAPYQVKDDAPLPSSAGADQLRRTGLVGGAIGIGIVGILLALLIAYWQR